MEIVRCKNIFGGFSDIPKEKISFRPTVLGIITDGEKILLLKVRNTDKFWFPGGGIEIGEKAEDALKREIKEETNLEAEIIKPLCFKENFVCWDPENNGYQGFLLFYLCKIQPEVKIDENFHDPNDIVEKPQWIKIDSLKPDSFTDLSEFCLEMIQSLTKS